MKTTLDKDERAVWDSIFSAQTGRTNVFNRENIWRTLNKLGLSPVMLRKRDGTYAPWDAQVYTDELYPLGNRTTVKQDYAPVDAFYLPRDVVEVAGGSPQPWSDWFRIQAGPSMIEDHTPYFTPPEEVFKYLRTLNKAPRNRSLRFLSTGAVAFYAGASLQAWDTLEARRRISPFKKAVASAGILVLDVNSKPLASPKLEDLIPEPEPKKEPAPMTTKRTAAEIQTMINALHAELKAVQERERMDAIMQSLLTGQITAVNYQPGTSALTLTVTCSDGVAYMLSVSNVL
jgi:hypothetical protein